MALLGLSKGPRTEVAARQQTENPTISISAIKQFVLLHVLESHLRSPSSSSSSSPPPLAQTKNEQLCTTEIQKQLDEVKPYRKNLSIFEVPRSLRKLEPNAYRPHVVSIGPYHRKAKHLEEMGKHKWRLLKLFLQRTKLEPGTLVKLMFQLEEKTRNCYDKPIEDFSKQQFVEMMLLDACFILELLYSYDDGWETNTSEWWDPFILRGFLPFIQRDLLMLENQLPLSVLAHLVSLTGEQDDEPDANLGRTRPIGWEFVAVTNLALKFFQSVIPGIYETPLEYPKDVRPPLHLLDIVHQFLEPPPEANDGDDDDQRNSEVATLSITRLRGTAVSFRKGVSLKITEIDFKDGKLLIPPLRIHGSTKSIFLNLMAFEQCYPHCKSHITSYISFMDGLIDSQKDVEYLRKKGVIVHDLGCEDDVATLFNNLRKEIVFHSNDYYLAKVSRQLNDHYKEKWRGWKATLKHEYLKDPWKIVSVGAASFLILLTLAQTTYTIVGYHLPSS